MPDLREGDAVGTYVLERAIDRGAFGRVWRARDTESDRIVAIKVLGTAALDDERVKARADLERLASAAAGDSRHIVRVLASGHEPVGHLVMEFIDGTNLRDVLNERGPLPQERVIQIGIEVADALRALHRVRVVHRDVKPANILLDQQGEVRLTDFGIAKILGYDETVTLTQQNLLSAPYAAPEVWEGAPNLHSDIYAFGCVLFEMLAGRPPFMGDLMDLFRQHRTAEPDMDFLPAHVAPALRELVFLCLRKPPGERPSSAEACLRMLEHARQELRQEPERFGPWISIEPHPHQLWAWHCRHERTGEEAVVEVHFAQDEAYGELLRSAVNLNPKLAPLGAERLLGANRLLLGENEGWANAPEHNLAFWVARQEEDFQPAEEDLEPYGLLRAAETFIKLIDIAAAANVRLSIDAERALVAQDGRVLLVRPGLPPPAPVEPRLGAFIFLRSLPLSDEAARVAVVARDLRDLRDRLTRPHSGGPTAFERSEQSRRPFMLAGGMTLAAIGFVIAALAFLPGGDNPGTSGQTQPTSTPPAIGIAACNALNLPAPIAEVLAACQETGPVTREYSEQCARGQVCEVDVSANAVRIRTNDRTIAFIDPSGDLSLARESDLSVSRLVQDGRISEPAWSPDGRYLAYVVSVTGQQSLTTELWVLDTQDLGSSAVIFRSSDGQDQPEWRRRHVSHPRWSADGRTVYFLWPPADDEPGALWSIDLPQVGSSLDIRQLRSWNGEPRNLNVSTLPATDSVTDGNLQSFTPAGDGALVVEVCSRDNGACGLGRWTGEGLTMLVPPAEGARFFSPLQVGDRFLALGIDGPDAVLLEVDGGGVIRPITRVAIGEPVGPMATDGLSLTASPDGKHAIVGSSTGLRAIALADGSEISLLSGRWASWYSAPVAMTVVSPPAPESYSTPGLTPTALPGPTAAPPGDTDLAAGIVTCAAGQELVVRVLNNGSRTLDRDVFMTVKTVSGGFTRVGTTNIGLTGLRPGQTRDIRTGYSVAEAVLFAIEYPRDTSAANNSVACAP